MTDSDINKAFNFLAHLIWAVVILVGILHYYDYRYERQRMEYQYRAKKLDLIKSQGLKEIELLTKGGRHGR